MRENEFQKALSDSLARIGRGESVEASMAAHPGAGGAAGRVSAGSGDVARHERAATNGTNDGKGTE